MIKMEVVFTSGEVLLAPEFTARYTENGLISVISRVTGTLNIRSSVKRNNICIMGNWSALLEAHDLLLDELRSSESTVKDLYEGSCQGNKQLQSGADHHVNTSNANTTNIIEDKIMKTTKTENPKRIPNNSEGIEHDNSLECSDINTDYAKEYNQEHIIASIQATAGSDKVEMVTPALEKINNNVHFKKVAGRSDLQILKGMTDNDLVDISKKPDKRKRGRPKHMVCKDGLYSCVRCGLTGKSKSEVGNHTMQCHAARYSCDSCESVFRNLKDIKKHKNTAHSDFEGKKGLGRKSETNREQNVFYGISGENTSAKSKRIKAKFPCIQCGYVGKSNMYLAVHIRRVHTRSFRCKICGKCYGYQRDLNRHYDTHANPKFQCKLCNKFYKTKWVYEQHMKNHEEDSFDRNESSLSEFSGNPNLNETFNDIAPVVSDDSSRNELIKKEYENKPLGDGLFFMDHSENKEITNKIPEDGSACTQSNYSDANCDLIYRSVLGDNDIIGKLLKDVVNQLDLESDSCVKAANETTFESNIDVLNELICLPNSEGSVFISNSNVELNSEHSRKETNTFDHKTDIANKHRTQFGLKRKRGRPKKPESTGMVFPCTVCSYIGKTEKHLRIHHIRCHSQRFSCEICGKCFGYSKCLRRHMEQVHPDQLHHCTICDKSYKTKSVYEQHMRNHHEEHSRENYKCDMCNKLFDTRVSVRNHIRSVHIGIENGSYICIACEKQFSNKWTFLQHCKFHTQLFICQVCDKGYSSKQSLQRHTALHDETVNLEAQKCRYCNKTFYKRYDLKCHIQQCNPAEYIRSMPFECKICSKRFKRNETLSKHMPTHMKTYSHPCDICSKVFKDNSSLIRHQHVHTGTKPFACSLCDMVSHDRGVLRRHVMLVHKTDGKRWREVVVLNVQNTNS